MIWKKRFCTLSVSSDVCTQDDMSVVKVTTIFQTQRHPRKKSTEKDLVNLMITKNTEKQILQKQRLANELYEKWIRQIPMNIHFQRHSVMWSRLGTFNRQKDAWLFNIPLTSFPSAISQSKVTMAKTTPWYTCSLGYKLLRRVRPVARPLSQFFFFLHSCWVRLFKIP